MFKSPIESYISHHRIDIDLGFLLTAARNTHEAIVAIEMEDLGVARQKWESVDGEALLTMWNAEDSKSEHQVPEWPQVAKPELDGPLAKQPTESLKRKVYERDGYRCRYCAMHVFTRSKGSRIHKLIKAFSDLTPGLHLINGSLYGSGKNGGIKNVDYAKFLWSLAAPDHVIPRSHGGPTDLDNLVTSCSGCNYSKMDLTLEQMNVHPPKTLP
jgi:5-methylcytosine-specific restriction endonuclease McrA